MRPFLPIFLGVTLASASPGRAELSAELAAACRAELPSEMAEAAGPGVLRGDGAAGRWAVEAGSMDGSGSDEAILVILPEGRPGRILFLAEREGKDPERKDVRLKGPPVTRVAVTFHEFSEGRSVAHVDAGESGQAILGWNGKKLQEIWKIGKVRDDERHWFNVEDLDADGVSEVIRYFRRELDVFTDEDELGAEGGAADRRQAGATDAVAVYRWDGDRWKEDQALLETRK